MAGSVRPAATPVTRPYSLRRAGVHSYKVAIKRVGIPAALPGIGQTQSTLASRRSAAHCARHAAPARGAWLLFQRRLPRLWSDDACCFYSPRHFYSFDRNFVLMFPSVIGDHIVSATRVRLICWRRDYL